MTVRLVSAFSPAMLDLSAVGNSHKVRFTVTTQEYAAILCNNPDTLLEIGHASTASLVQNMLNLDRECFNRSNLKLESGDILVLAQYSGPRLEEGCTELPEGAKITWVLVSVNL